MTDRCINPNCQHYEDYGGRGITVCDRWVWSFVAFLEDMGKRPSSKHSLERVDNMAGYHPGNCKWVLRAEQLRNTRKNLYLDLDGKVMCLADWTKELRVTATWFRRQVLNGQPVRGKKFTVVQGYTKNHVRIS